MIRAHRVAATAQDDASMISGWNISPNMSYTLYIVPSASACAVFLFNEGMEAMIASGATPVGTDQPCVFVTQGGYELGMIDAELGWHIMLTIDGTESARTIRVNPSVDLPDEIHPIYGDDDLALVRATAGIDASAHYIDELTISCPLGLGAGIGGVVSGPVDGVAVVGQVESITWAGTPDGTPEQAVIRRHVAIAPAPYVDPEPVTPPSVADDEAETDADTMASGNLLANDEAGLVVVAVNGLAANVGVTVDGSDGGTFTIASDGAWTFDPAGDFPTLLAIETQVTSIIYFVSDGVMEAQAELRVTVRGTLSVLLELVGSVAGNATSANITMTLPEGIQPGDMVLVAVGCAQTSNKNPYMITSGYSPVGDWYVDAQFRDPNLAIFYKFMGETPDTTVVCNGNTGWASAASRAVVHVWRNVSQITPFDVPFESAGLAVSTNVTGGPYSPSITPLTTGAIVITVGCAGSHPSFGTDSFSCPVGVENCISGNSNASSLDFMLGMGSIAWNGVGAVSPGEWRNRLADPYGGAGMIAVTLALHPA